MENIGSFLQEKRKEKGLSIDEISSVTRLHSNIIKNIESNEFERLGGSGYTKILITTYARALGLSPKEIENLVSKAPKKEFKTNCQPREILHPPTILIHKNIFLLILLIIVIAVLTIVVVNLYRNERLTFPFRPDNTTEEVTEPPVILPPAEELQPGPESENIELNSYLHDNETHDMLMLADISPEQNLESDQPEEGSGIDSGRDERRYIFDRRDYLTEYNVLRFREQDRDYFGRYVASF